MNNSTTSQPKEESLIKVAKETFFKKNGEAPQSKTVENVANCTLANVFARKSAEKKEEIKQFIEGLYKETTLFARVGTPFASKSLVEEGMQILNAFCHCDNKEILRQILMNDNLNVGNLRILVSNKDPKISSFAKGKLDRVFREVSNKIAEKDVNVKTWGTNSFYAISFNSVDKAFKEFKNKLFVTNKLSSSENAILVEKVSKKIKKEDLERISFIRKFRELMEKRITSNAVVLC